MPFIVISATAISDETSGNKLLIEIPSKGDTGWADELKTKFFQKVVDHDHSGSGNGKKVNILNLDKVQSDVSPADGNALIWNSSNDRFQFQNPQATVNPTCLSVVENTSSDTAISTSFSPIIPSTSSVLIEHPSPGATGWQTSTGQYIVPTSGKYRYNVSVLLKSVRNDSRISVRLKKIDTGNLSQPIKTVIKKFKSNVPVGSIIAWASDSAGPGSDWLRCNGQEIGQTNYPDLYEAIGATYNTHNGKTVPSNTSLNFRVPNHAGEFLRDRDTATIETVEADATSADGLSASSSASLSGTTGTGTTGSKDLDHRHYVVRNTVVSTGKDSVTGSSHYAAARQNNNNNDGNYDMNGSNSTANWYKTSDPIDVDSGNMNHNHSIPSLSVTVSGSVTTTLSGESETRPENTKVEYWIKAQNIEIEQITFTGIVFPQNANDKLVVEIKGDHSEGLSIVNSDIDALGFQFELEKLE